MNKPPAFQFYVDNFIEGTTEFDDVEVGLYMRLLCAQWTRGSLPNDDNELMRFSRGATTLQLARVKTKFDVGDDGRLRNARLERERVKQAAWRQKSSEGGKKSSETRKGGLRVVQPPCQPKGNTPVSSLQSPSPDFNKEDIAGNGTPEPPKEGKKVASLPISHSLEEVKLLAEKTGLPESEAIKFWNFYESKGWMVGKNRMKSLGGAMGGWKARYEEKKGQAAVYDPNQDWRNSL